MRSFLAQTPLGRKAWHAVDARRAARAAGTTRVRRAGVRLLIAPVNSAEQGFAWARAAERLPGVAAADFMYRDATDVFRFRADHSVGTVFFRTNRPWQRAQRRAILRRFSHVMVESGRQVLGADDSLRDQIAGMRSKGISVALVFHGSDLRIPSVHFAREADSPFHPTGYPETARLEEIARQNHRLIEVAGLPVFVSTPDLLEDAPGAIWLPVVVDSARWCTVAPSPPLSRARPIVVHAPSNAGLKGSDPIGPSLRRLDGEGLIEYRELSGVASDEMPGHYGAADIVLDQFSLGIYGVAACEAMASGRLVISHVSPFVRSTVEDATGRQLPILESTAADLEATLRTIVADPAPHRETAARGPAFVREVHDGRRSSLVLAPFLNVRPAGPSGAVEQ